MVTYAESGDELAPALPTYRTHPLTTEFVLFLRTESR